MKKNSICKICGKEFKYATHQSKGIYCSKRCRYEDHSHIVKSSYTDDLKKKRSLIAKKQWDENEENAKIKSISKQNKKDKELIQKQKQIDKINNRKNICSQCHKEYLIDVRNKNVKFCSKNCFQLFQKENASNYRIKAFALLPNICKYCDEVNKKKLEVHHIDGDFLNNDISNLEIVCSKCHNKRHKTSALKGRIGKFKDGQILRGLRLVLDGLRLDLKDENFIGTPERILRSYYEIFAGIKSEDEIDKIFETTFPSNYDGIVIIKDIDTYSMCPHHFLPVIYRVNVGYISNQKMVGASKLPRVVELLARQPILQETFTENIALAIESNLKAEGVMVTVSGQHLCMKMRGIEKQNSSMETSAIKGLFKDLAVRNEFFNLIGG